MIYTRSSIEFILSALKCHDITSLNPGLNGGKIGYAVLIMSAFQKYGASTVDTSQIDLVRNIIKESLSNLCPPDKGFMTGNSGIIWGLRKLYNMGVIEQSKKFDQFADIIIRHGLASFYSQSESITPENEIYPWGITLLPFWNGSDTLSRYLYEEKILLCLIECERILNGDEPYSFLSAHKNYALLHSILYFASKAYALGIGPIRTKRLIENITTRCYIAENGKNSVDAAILNALILKESVCLPNHADSLAYLGTIALMYDMPELFLPTYRVCNTGTNGFSQMTPEKLIGIGLGLICSYGDK